MLDWFLGRSGPAADQERPWTQRFSNPKPDSRPLELVLGMLVLAVAAATLVGMAGRSTGLTGRVLMVTGAVVCVVLALQRILLLVLRLRR